MPDIRQIAERGEIGLLQKVEGELRCCFVYNHAVACVTKPFGWQHGHVKPTLLTVFPDDEFYDPTPGELTYVPKVIEREVPVPGPERVVVKLPEELTDEDLRCLVAARRGALSEKIARLRAEVAAKTAELAALEDAQQNLGGSR